MSFSRNKVQNIIIRKKGAVHNFLEESRSNSLSGKYRSNSLPAEGSRNILDEEKKILSELTLLTEVVKDCCGGHIDNWKVLRINKLYDYVIGLNSISIEQAKLIFALLVIISSVHRKDSRRYYRDSETESIKGLLYLINNHKDSIITLSTYIDINNNVNRRHLENISTEILYGNVDLTDSQKILTRDKKVKSKEAFMLYFDFIAYEFGLDQILSFQPIKRDTKEINQRNPYFKDFEEIKKRIDDVNRKNEKLLIENNSISFKLKLALEAKKNVDMLLAEEILSAQEKEKFLNIEFRRSLEKITKEYEKESKDLTEKIRALDNELEQKNRYYGNAKRDNEHLIETVEVNNNRIIELLKEIEIKKGIEEDNKSTIKGMNENIILITNKSLELHKKINLLRDENEYLSQEKENLLTKNNTLKGNIRDINNSNNKKLEDNINDKNILQNKIAEYEKTNEKLQEDIDKLSATNRSLQNELMIKKEEFLKDPQEEKKKNALHRLDKIMQKNGHQRYFDKLKQKVALDKQREEITSQFTSNIEELDAGGINKAFKTTNIYVVKKYKDGADSHEYSKSLNSHKTQAIIGRKYTEKINEIYGLKLSTNFNINSNNDFVAPYIESNSDKSKSFSKRMKDILNMETKTGFHIGDIKENNFKFINDYIPYIIDYDMVLSYSDVKK